jgi:uncharacterized repeat protein (TIGR01451 family)
MWNGFGKLAVMVGVIGIGLFAVFQAQKGMSRVASLEPSAAEQPAAEERDESAAVDSLRSTDNRERAVALDRAEPDRPAARARRNTQNERIDLVGNYHPETNSPSVKTALGSTRTHSGQVELARRESRPQPVRLQDENENPFEQNAVLIERPRSLPDAGAGDTESEAAAATTDTTVVTTDTTAASPDAPEDSSIKSPEDLSARELSPIGKPAEDPFDEDFSSSSDSLKSTFDKSPALPAILNADEEAPIPRSRRAMQNSEQKLQVPVEIESDPFDFEPKEKPGDVSPPANEEANEEADAFEGALPELTVPEALSEPDSTQLPSERISPPDSRATPTTKRNHFADDEPPSAREESTPFPARDPLRRPTTGQPKSFDDDRDLLGESAPLKRNPDRNPHAEMTGDGVAGDDSQRGLQQPRLTIEKVAQQQAVIEQPLVYTIIVRNTGTVAAHHVVIEDRIPKGTELLGTSPRAELVGKDLIWKEPVLRPNEEKRISIKVIPKQEGPIGSVARVHFATEVTAEIQVSAPQLEFTVNAPKEVRMGQNFDLVFQLKNVGKVEASNIMVRDLVPDHLKHETGNDIECPIGKLAPNEIREIVLPVTAVKTGGGVNRAILTADSGIKKQLDSSVDVVGDQLVLTRTGQNRIYVERPVVFTNTIRNEGNLKVSKVRISEVVPAGMEFETASDGGKFDPNLNSVIWTLGVLEPGDDRALTVKYVPKETGTLAGKITATGASGSSAAINSTVEVIGRPALQMETLSDTGLVTIGDKITSKFQLKNMGTSAARNVQLTIQLPPELRLVTVHGNRFRQQKNTLIFDPIDELSPRTNAVFELVLEPMEEADARIVIEISADHLAKPHRREESIHIGRDELK